MSVSRRTFLRGALFGVGGSIATAAYGDLDSRGVRLEKVELRLQNWRADGLRVGFMSDIHVNDPEEVQRAVSATKLLVDESPDLLIFGGDAVNTMERAGIENVLATFEPAQKLKCPKVAVLGNHDYWSGASADVERNLSLSGFLILKNQIESFGEFHVAGYDDRIGGLHDPMFMPERLGTISVMHEPDDVDIVPGTVSLQLSGHSHGGQMCMPLGIPLHTPKGARKYTKGYYPDAKVPLYVSRGVGTTGPKWRMFCPPEVTILTLRSAA